LHSFFKRSAAGTPLVKLSLSAYAHLINFWEVDVMHAKSTQFCHARESSDGARDLSGNREALDEKEEDEKRRS
jgi:hypothetical protein